MMITHLKNMQLYIPIKKRAAILTVLSFLFCGYAAIAQQIVTTLPTKDGFPIVGNNAVATILLDQQDHKGVLRAAADLQRDIGWVTDTTVPLGDEHAQNAIIIGTIGKNKTIDKLIANGTLRVAGIAGKWESTLIEVVNNPLPGIDRALVIAGSDKRGTIYGIYEISKQIGVSPWYYWADIPVRKSDELYVKSGRFVTQSPAVKYRGIFLNDEAPALSGWTRKTFGGFNHEFYEHVFELILRLKGNFLWPAMWGNAFIDDDPVNPVLADEYGVVIGTSHHEPLTRAHDEWRRYGEGGAWDYQKNPDQLREFWKSGLERVHDKDIVVTVGMRGDGDEPMTEGTAIELLEQIVTDQRDIIRTVTQKPAEETPQVWALYKEVLDYYDNGMRVPDDVTLLLCDDNWGNLRRLPKLHETPRKGGYGIYYHFDYVGGPRNYKWLNTNPIQKTWEQMRLAHEYGANQLWIVNVGDLKPMEFPISFFLDFAWNPEAIPAEQLAAYTEAWAGEQFGAPYAAEIGYLIDQYSKFAGRIKPELLNARTYSLVNYSEWQRVTADYRALLTRAEYLQSVLEDDAQDAFYQLVLHPIQAMNNLYALYEAHAKNQLYAQQGRNTTNFWAGEVARLFERDIEITDYYNNQLADGKWQHMMDQTHIGYRSWQEPRRNTMPDTTRITVPNAGHLGVAVEGNTAFWTGTATADSASLQFNNLSRATHYLELFNRGRQAVSYRIDAPDYLLLSHNSGEITEQTTIDIHVDWNKAPQGTTDTHIEISDGGATRVTVPIRVANPTVQPDINNLFVERDGYISMEAPNYSRAFNRAPVFWKTIDNYGKTTGGVTVIPATIGEQEINDDTPRLTYDVYVSEAGTYELHTYHSPTVDFTDSGGMRFGLSVNDNEPVTVTMDNVGVDHRSWSRSVVESARVTKTSLHFERGKNTITYWLVSPAVVLQKLVLDTGGLKDSFLGPLETFYETTQK